MSCQAKRGKEVVTFSRSTLENGGEVMIGERNISRDMPNSRCVGEVTNSRYLGERRWGGRGEKGWIVPVKVVVTEGRTRRILID